MAGTFSKANRPALPGSYFNFEAKQSDPVVSSPGTAVALLFRHDWGPLDEVVRCTSFGEWQSIFGDSDDTEGYLAARQAFYGEGGYGGRYGCGELVCIRIAGSSAAKSAKTINKTGGGSAITLTAKYHGTAGDDLVAEVSTVSSGVDRLRILKGTVEVERYDYTDTNITDLAAQINDRSQWVVASGVTSGTDLDQATDGALTGGNDGTTLLAADYTDAVAQLEVEPFAVFNPGALTDSGITTTLAAWVADQNTKGKRFFGVFGGAASESMSTAVTRSTGNDDPNVLNVGGFDLYDSVHGADGEEVALSSSQVAARIAGIVAGRGEYASLVGARLPGTRIKNGATYAETVDAYDNGVVTIARDSNAESPVYVRVGFTTWSSASATADPSRPYKTYRQPKYVRTMHGIESDLTAEGQDAIGLGGVDENARTARVGSAKRVLAARESAGVIQSGWTASIDQDPPPTDEDEFIAVRIGLSFSPSLDQIFWTANI